MSAGRSGGRSVVLCSSTTSATVKVENEAVSLTSGRRPTVNGSGCRPSTSVSYVNHCEEALGGRNEMVLSQVPSQVSCNDHSVTNSIRQSASFAEVAVLYAQSNVKLVDSLQSQCRVLEKIVSEKADTIKKMTEEMQFYKQNMEKKFQELEEARAIVAREECLTIVPSTPVLALQDSISMPPEQPRSIKNKKRKNCSTVDKQPIINPIENNRAKNKKTRSRKPCGETKDLCLITDDKPYYTCLGNFDPVNDDAPGIKNSNLEIPSWRIKPFTSWYSMEGTENMSDDVFESRHAKFEVYEQKRKRWDLQRMRELKRNEYLKERHNKNHLQNDKEEDTSTLLPNPANIKAIELTNNLPVSAFGLNLHTKKNAPSFKFYETKFLTDGSQMPNDGNKRGLRSSGRHPLVDCYASLLT